MSCKNPCVGVDVNAFGIYIPMHGAIFIVMIFLRIGLAMRSHPNRGMICAKPGQGWPAHGRAHSERGGWIMNGPALASGDGREQRWRIAASSGHTHSGYKSTTHSSSMPWLRAFGRENVESNLDRKNHYKKNLRIDPLLGK